MRQRRGGPRAESPDGPLHKLESPFSGCNLVIVQATSNNADVTGETNANEAFMRSAA